MVGISKPTRSTVDNGEWNGELLHAHGRASVKDVLREGAIGQQMERCIQFFTVNDVHVPHEISACFQIKTTPVRDDGLDMINLTQGRCSRMHVIHHYDLTTTIQNTIRTSGYSAAITDVYLRVQHNRRIAASDLCLDLPEALRIASTAGVDIIDL